MLKAAFGSKDGVRYGMAQARNSVRIVQVVRSDGSKGEEAAPPFRRLPQHYGMSPFSEREAGCDQKHSIVVGQKIGHVHGRVL